MMANVEACIGRPSIFKIVCKCRSLRGMAKRIEAVAERRENDTIHHESDERARSLKYFLEM